MIMYMAWLQNILSAKRKYNPKLVNIFANSQHCRLTFSPLSLNVAFYPII